MVAGFEPLILSWLPGRLAEALSQAVAVDGRALHYASARQSTTDPQKFVMNTGGGGSTTFVFSPNSAARPCARGGALKDSLSPRVVYVLWQR